jgi:hypothetical protein
MHMITTAPNLIHVICRSTPTLPLAGDAKFVAALLLHLLLQSGVIWPTPLLLQPNSTACRNNPYNMMV